VPLHSGLSRGDGRGARPWTSCRREPRQFGRAGGLADADSTADRRGGAMPVPSAGDGRHLFGR
jgi:hypothetical protein